MERRTFLANLIGLATVAGASTLPAHAGTQGHHLKHVVYELDEKDLNREIAVLRNVRNNINASGAKNMHLEVVIHGGGIHLLERALTNQDLQATIDTLKMDGVRFRVCHNTIVSNKLDYHKDLYDVHKKDIVPSGVAYLVDRQLQGWAYMHP
jgi:intracellular sulfur oxidation DsrE/DsrF family protein